MIDKQSTKVPPTMNESAMLGIQEWHDNQFLPWMESVKKARELQAQQRGVILDHMAQFQDMLGLLMDGKPLAAVHIWNSLNLHPRLKSMQLVNGGDTVQFVEESGRKDTVAMSDVVSMLESISRG